MKMVKKSLLGLVAVAALICLSGCKPPEGGNSGMIKVSGSSASIDYVNGTTLTRGFKTLKTNHLDAICKIVTTINEIPSGELGTENGKRITNGVMGVIFNYAEDKTAGTANFSIAGTRWNQSSNKLEAYVETFKNVELAALEEELTGGTKATGLSYSGWGQALDGNYKNGDKVTIWIEIIANDGTTAGRNGTQGTYTVKFYDSDPGRKVALASNQWALTYDNSSVQPTETCTINLNEVQNKYDSKTPAALKNMEADIGFYANVQPNDSLIGSWKFEKIAKEAEEITE